MGLDREFKHVHLVGVELEGGWKENPPGRYGDGSVHVSAPYVGEVHSAPSFPRHIADYITEFYPNVVDKSCGFHIHVSTRTYIDYCRLMAPRFAARFYDRFESDAFMEILSAPDRAMFKPRLAGTNTYCKREFVPEHQVGIAGKSHVRYTHLNFCYSLHKTIECRLLPMFVRAETAVKAAAFLLDTIEDYLREIEAEGPVETPLEFAAESWEGTVGVGDSYHHAVMTYPRGGSFAASIPPMTPLEQSVKDTVSLRTIEQEEVR